MVGVCERVSVSKEYKYECEFAEVCECECGN